MKVLFLYLLLIALVGVSGVIGFVIGLHQQGAVKCKSPIPVDLPEEYQAISHNPKHPERMDVYIQGDTLRVQFVSKSDSLKRAGEYQLVLEPNGTFIYDNANDSTREVGFIEWKVNQHVSGIDSIILSDNL